MTGTDLRRIVVLGGYGAAGGEICRLLATRHTGTMTEILVVGRNRNRAETISRRLNAEAPAEVRFLPRRADANDPEALPSLLAGATLVISALSLSVPALTAIGEHLISGADFIDIRPDSGTGTVMKAALERQRPARSRVILGAGADPGLPGWLARYAAAGLNRPESIRLYARYRSPDLTRASVEEILEHTLKPGRLFRGTWKRAGILNSRLFRFRGGFGRTLCIPVFLEELRAVPAERGLKRFGLYHGGINARTDLLIGAWKAGLHRLLPRSVVRERVRRAAARHTKSPAGISLEARVRGPGERFTTGIYHTDIYEATALPAVLTARKLLAHPDRKPGIYLLGEWVDPGEFAGDLEECGFTLYTET